jgi:hypothetical protein
VLGPKFKPSRHPKKKKERETSAEKKIVAKDLSDKGLSSKIYRELNINKVSHPEEPKNISDHRRDIDTDISL